MVSSPKVYMGAIHQRSEWRTMGPYGGPALGFPSYLDVLAEMRVQGETLQDIGDWFEPSITRERVRQLSEEALPGHKFPPAWRKRHTFRYSPAAVKSQEDLIGRFLAGENLGELAKEYGYSHYFVRNLVLEKVTTDEMRMRRAKLGSSNTGREIPTSELILQMRAGAELLGEPMQALAYNELAKERGWRGYQTLIKRFGGWKGACEAAGIVPGKHGTRRRSDYKATEVLLTDLVYAHKHFGRLFSSTEYITLSEEFGLTSLATVRNRFGSWSEVLQALTEYERGENETL